MKLRECTTGLLMVALASCTAPSGAPTSEQPVLQRGDGPSAPSQTREAGSCVDEAHWRSIDVAILGVRVWYPPDCFTPEQGTINGTRLVGDGKNFEQFLLVENEVDPGDALPPHDRAWLRHLKTTEWSFGLMGTSHGLSHTMSAVAGSAATMNVVLTGSLIGDARGPGDPRIKVIDRMRDRIEQLAASP